MYCRNCGEKLPENAQFCSKCGTAQFDVQQQDQQKPVMEKSVQEVPAFPAGLTKKEFYRHPANKGWRTDILVCAIFLYLCAGITLTYNVIVSQNIFGLIDVIILLASGLCIQLFQSRAAAVVVTVYGIVNMLLIITVTGEPGGYMVVIVSVLALIATFRFQKAWDSYQKRLL